MDAILLCTHDPILVKSLYGILRDEGYEVEIADHLFGAVQMVLENDYCGLIMDSRTFGLSAEDAVRIIKVVSPGMQVIIIGRTDSEEDVFCTGRPADLEELKHAVNAFRITSKNLHNQGGV